MRRQASRPPSEARRDRSSSRRRAPGLGLAPSWSASRGRRSWGRRVGPGCRPPCRRCIRTRDCGRPRRHPGAEWHWHRCPRPCWAGWGDPAGVAAHEQGVAAQGIEEAVGQPAVLDATQGCRLQPASGLPQSEFLSSVEDPVWRAQRKRRGETALCETDRTSHNRCGLFCDSYSHRINGEAWLGRG